MPAYLITLCYVIFLGGWATGAYKTCGSELLRMSEMKMVSGTLLRAERVGQPMVRSNAKVQVDYQFKYNGQIVTGNQIATCTSGFGGGSVVDPYYDFFASVKPRVNGEVTIWFDPESPDINYLFKHVPRWWALIFVFLLLLGLLICFSFLHFIKLVIQKNKG
jgi:Protein of unknown function (DUF3592)